MLRDGGDRPELGDRSQASGTVGMVVGDGVLDVPLESGARNRGYDCRGRRPRRPVEVRRQDLGVRRRGVTG